MTHADIDTSNDLAERGEFDLVKVSYAALPWLLEEYALLPSGGAVGRGCGPLVLTGPTGSTDPAALAGGRVAIPSQRSTANLLFRLWADQLVPGGPGALGQVLVLPYHQIMTDLAAGRLDAGLVIHEARFTYQRYGLRPVADLGQWWEGETGLPIPLGAIVARRSLGTERIAELAGFARASVEYAWARPQASLEYTRSLVHEPDPAVIAAHTELYVNEFTRDLGEEGYAAVTALLDRAVLAGLVPKPLGPLR